MTTSIPKPQVHHPALPVNTLGFTRRDYEGALSTLCAGCGHDSITAALVRACWELNIEPHRVAKLSGIGCSSKTPAYFLREAHGFNSVHGRMPSVATGANAANRELLYVGISGDGDSLSIGLGQFCHAVRRNINVLYLLENNGVYGLTKGQFSASADIGSRPKKGEPNLQQPIDPAVLALALGCTFVARSFSGDKEQLVPILKAALAHRGFAFVDVISPCVTFNDHEGSTKSYNYTRDHLREAVEVDFVEAREEIAVSYPEGEVTTVVMHDGSRIRLRKVAADYDIHDRDAAYAALRGAAVAGEVLTGILHVASGVLEMHQLEKTPDAALTALPHETLCPGAAELDRLMERFR